MVKEFFRGTARNEGYHDIGVLDNLTVVARYVYSQESADHSLLGGIRIGQ